MFAEDGFKNALYNLLIEQGETLGMARTLDEALEVIATLSERELRTDAQEPKERLLSILKDGRWRSLEPHELRRLKYVARYYEPPESELAKAGLSQDSFVAGKTELLAAVEALPPQPTGPERVPFVRCNGCGELTPPDALADTAIMPAVCPACYVSYEEDKPRWPDR